MRAASLLLSHMFQRHPGSCEKHAEPEGAHNPVNDCGNDHGGVVRFHGRSLLGKTSPGFADHSPENLPWSGHRIAESLRLAARNVKDETKSEEEENNPFCLTRRIPKMAREEPRSGHRIVREFLQETHRKSWSHLRRSRG